MPKSASLINYETMRKIAESIGSANNLTDVANHVVHQLTDALELKGVALMLLNRRNKKLEVAAAAGLSDEYLNKGPLSALKSIAESITEGPVAIYNVEDDPRMQYPQEAVKEGIKSILSVPMRIQGKPLGVLRLYTGKPWEFTMADLTFAQAVAELIALVIDNLRLTNAYKSSIEVLKVLRPVIRPRKRTLSE